MMDSRQTRCFVIKSGKPGENIAKALWEQRSKFSFASSANPSGQGNRGLVEGIDERKITPCPVLIRKGLNVDKILALLSEILPSWDYRHVDYY